jgi:hypothetical protein
MDINPGVVIDPRAEMKLAYFLVAPIDMGPATDGYPDFFAALGAAYFGNEIDQERRQGRAASDRVAMALKEVLGPADQVIERNPRAIIGFSIRPGARFKFPSIKHFEGLFDGESDIGNDHDAVVLKHIPEHALDTVADQNIDSIFTHQPDLCEAVTKGASYNLRRRFLTFLCGRYQEGIGGLKAGRDVIQVLWYCNSHNLCLIPLAETVPIIIKSHKKLYYNKLTLMSKSYRCIQCNTIRCIATLDVLRLDIIATFGLLILIGDVC